MANNVRIGYTPLVESAEAVTCTDGSAVVLQLTASWSTIGTLTISSDGTWDIDMRIGLALNNGAAGVRLLRNGALLEDFSDSSGNYGVYFSRDLAAEAFDLSTKNKQLSSGDVLTLQVNEVSGTAIYRGNLWPLQFTARKVAGFVPEAAQVSGVVRSNSGYTDTVIGGQTMRTVWGVNSGNNPISVTFEQPFAAVPHLEFNDGLDASSYREYKILTKTATGFTAECRFSGGAATIGSLAWRATGRKP